MTVNGQSSRLGMAAAVIAVVVAMPAMMESHLQAQAPGAQQGARGQRFRATQPVVRDAATGRRRMPTETEVTQMVASLSTLTERPTNLPDVTTAQGAVAVNLAGGYNGVVLAKANEDGSVETLCVFTFDEGAAFLGLVPVIE